MSLETKSLLWVYAQRPTWEGSYIDLLIYSVIVKKDRFQESFTTTQLAVATGINEETVQQALVRLERANLLKSGLPQYRPDLFFTGDDTKGHWSERLRFWKTLIRAQSSPLKVSDVMLFSFLRDKREAGYSPIGGWSVGYLAVALAMDRATITAALDRLEKLNLVKQAEDQILVARSLTSEQLTYFRDRGVYKRGGKSLGDFEPDGAIATPLSESNVVVALADKCAEYLGSQFAATDVAPFQACLKECLLECRHRPLEWQTICDHISQKYRKEENNEE